MITEATLIKDKEEQLNLYASRIDAKFKIKEDAINSLDISSDEKSAKLAALNKQKEVLLKKKEHQEDKKVKNTLKLSKRIFEIDLLRGIVILGMFIDHTIFNFSDKGLFNVVFNFHNYSGALSWVGGLNQFCTYFYDNPVRIAIRFFGIIILFLLTGISSHFSRHNVKRGLMTMGVGVVITLIATLVAFITNNGSFFMILCIITTLGLAILIYHGVYKLYCLLYHKYEDKLFKEKKFEKLTIKDDKLVYTKNPIALNKYILITGLVILVGWLLTTFLVYINSPYTAYEVEHGAIAGANHTPMDYLSHIYLIFVGDGNHIGWDRIGVDGFSWANFDFVYLLKVILGLRGFGFDWLGLFPFVGFTFIGGYIGLKFYREKRSILYRFSEDKTEITNPDYLSTDAGQKNLKYNLRFRFITFMGNHSLFMYIFHQPMIFIFFGLLFLIFGAGFNI